MDEWLLFEQYGYFVIFVLTSFGPDVMLIEKRVMDIGAETEILPEYVTHSWARTPGYWEPVW